MVDGFAVIVPAHNEEDEIEGSLESVMASVAHARRTCAVVHIRVIVVADACTDNTLDLVTDFASRNPIVEVVTVSFNNVGFARNAAGEHFIGQRRIHTQQELGALWLAFTDADSRVPEHWIASHIRNAELGVDCIVGTVAPRPETGTVELLAKWHAAHELGEDHPYVFGANLGVRGTYFELVGGIPPLPCGEDAALVAAVLDAGGRVLRTDTCRVLTSARLEGRAAGGFSTYLQELA
ncbi:glycosyltransferase family 2 protein [Brevibacterium aurantiacum]|uniref:4,4'-diaponeurosporenoate glycosyltransferase n=1 Tax=Brevibacterium aurantiacum TaxID=273384 RepID=A0A556C8Z2_BREAU|nr:glycosyltransferase [Brevibacterium aurantiacum]TSI13871.1 glycosyltransferase [Brevibacterium aurantiacum]